MIKNSPSVKFELISKMISDELIGKDKDLSDKEINFIVALIMEWIKKNKDG